MAEVAEEDGTEVQVSSPPAAAAATVTGRAPGGHAALLRVVGQHRLVGGRAAPRPVRGGGRVRGGIVGRFGSTVGEGGLFARPILGVLVRRARVGVLGWGDVVHGWSYQIQKVWLRRAILTRSY